MYIYLITNLVNNKKYVGQTSDYQRRMTQHKTQKDQLIDKKIQQYGAQNFSFQIIEQDLSPEEADEKEKYYIQTFNSLVPNGYNIHTGGRNNSLGEENHRAKITEAEAQWILDNRNIPEKELYERCAFKDRISYNQFRQIYIGNAWCHLKTDVQPANNLSHKGEDSGRHVYTNEEVYEIRENYRKGVYFKEAWELSGKKMTLESFYQLYIGRGYTNVHYDVYTDENKKKHKPDHSCENNGRAKLTKEDVIKIRELSKTLSNSEIYKLYPQVSDVSIRNIINYKTWKNI